MFYADYNQAELVCAKCGRVETIDGDVLNAEQLYNNNNMQRKGHYNPMYNFNYSLNNILGITPFTKLGIDNGEKVLSELRQKIKEYNWHPESLSVEKIWPYLILLTGRIYVNFNAYSLHNHGKPPSLIDPGTKGSGCVYLF